MNNSVRLICGIFGIALLISSTANASTLRLVLETDDDSGGGSEVFVSSFGNFDDFINSPPGGGTGAFSGIDIAPGFSVAGFAYDGMYRLLLESNDDSGALSEVFVSSFANFDDFINSPPGGGTGAFSGIDIAPGFSTRGFAYEFDDPVGQIPLPAALWFFAAGLGPLAYAQKKRRDARKPERRRSAFFL